jgi:hypothetical protein
MVFLHHFLRRTGVLLVLLVLRLLLLRLLGRRLAIVGAIPRGIHGVARKEKLQYEERLLLC